MDAHAVCRKHMKAHFAGTIALAVEKEMREHLASCGSCGRRYERHQLFSALDPNGLGAYERIGRSLGLRPRMRAPAHLGAWIVAAAAACCIGVLLPRAMDQRAVFSARGALGTSPSKVEVYRAQPHQRFELAADTIRSTDELAFAYANPPAYPYLAVCGVDEHRHVYWYHPAWSTVTENPQSVAIQDGPALHELPEAISQAIDGRTLRIVAVFSRQALRVRDMEREIQRASGPNPSLEGVLSDAFGDVLVSTRTLKVAP